MTTWILVIVTFYGCDCRPAIVKYSSEAACKAAQLAHDGQPKAVATTISFCLPGEA